MVFNATFNTMSAIWWQSVLLVEVPGENHRPVASHRQTLSYNVVSSAPLHERDSNSQLDYTGSCNSNHHTITTTTAPINLVDK